MKMCGIGCGILWGTMFILIGLIMILNILLNIKIPVFRVLLAVFFIYIGMAILMGSPVKKRERITTIKDYEIQDTLKEGDKYDIIFGERSIDLTGIKVGEKGYRVDIKTAFGRCILKINDTLPTKLIVSSAFANATLPNGNRFAFGTSTYKTASFDENKPYLSVYASVAFGNLDIIGITPQKEETQSSDDQTY